MFEPAIRGDDVVEKVHAAVLHAFIAWVSAKLAEEDDLPGGAAIRAIAAAGFVQVAVRMLHHRRLGCNDLSSIGGLVDQIT